MLKIGTGKRPNQVSGDLIIPDAAGGMVVKENIVAACRTCNSERFICIEPYLICKFTWKCYTIIRAVQGEANGAAQG